MKKAYFLISIIFFLLLIVGCDENDDHTHSYEATTVIEPTCADEGFTIFECSCGEKYNDKYTDPTGNHTYGDWITEIEATETSNGVRYRLCKICEFRDEEVTSKLEHNTHNFEKLWSFDNDYHWHDCIFEGCEEVDDHAEHDLGEWLIQVEATYLFPGVKVRTCKICPYQEVINYYHEHTAEEEWSYDTDGHWHMSNCDSHIPMMMNDYAEHTFEKGVCTVCGYEYSTPGLWFTLKNDSYYSVHGQGITESTIVIPNTINGKPVKEIADWGFFDCDFRDISLPDSITTIGTHAFENCKYLTRITIPSQVMNIEEDAFIFCSNLVEVYNLSSLEITKNDSSNGGVGKYAKYIHTSLEEESHLVEEEDYVFIFDDLNQYYLVGYFGTENYITLPSTINENSYEFYEVTFFSNIKGVTIPYGFTKIADGAFSSCLYLEYVELPNSITRIGSYAFSDCGKLKSIVLPESLLAISEAAFSGCIRLKEIYNLTSSLVITLGSKSHGCIGLHAEVVHKSLEEESCIIEKDDFVFFKGEWKYSLIDYIGEDCYAADDRQIILPSDINGMPYEISENAFELLSLPSITIPASIRKLGDLFGHIVQKDVYYTGTLKDWCECEMDYSASSVSHLYLKNQNDEWVDLLSMKTLIIPQNIQSIGINNFAGFSNFESVVLPITIKELDEFVFWGCPNLNTVYYEGTERDWEKVSNDWYNFESKTIYYYSEVAPATSGNYWHYDGENIVLW